MGAIRRFGLSMSCKTAEEDLSCFFRVRTRMIGKRMKKEGMI